jgi:hypothetical protein
MENNMVPVQKLPEKSMKSSNQYSEQDASESEETLLVCIDLMNYSLFS